MLGQDAAIKLRPPPGATVVSQAVGEDDAVVPRWMVEGCIRQRRRLLWPAKKIYWPLHHISSCKTSMKFTQSSSAVYERLYMYCTCRSPPPACQYTQGGPHPPPHRKEWRRGSATRDGCHAATVSIKDYKDRAGTRTAFSQP
jgi:hypothetical protein